MPDQGAVAAEAATSQPEPETSVSKTREAIKALSEKLRRQEAKTVAGAPGLEPKTRMLDVRSISEMNPDHHFRYVNVTDPEKVKLRRDRGYVPVSDEEAKEAGVSARHGNELVLMKVPRAEYNRRVEMLRALNQARLRAHKAEVAGAAEAIVRELRDKHGIDIPLERLLVEE